MYLQPPRDESLNGLLQGYRIYYRELESETSSATVSKTLKTPSALRAELAGETLSLSQHRCRTAHPGEERLCTLAPCTAWWEMPWRARGDAARLQGGTATEVDRSGVAPECMENGGPWRAPGLWGLAPAVEIREGFMEEEPFEIGCQGKGISPRTQGRYDL